jgi:hypothetical protein
MAKNSEFPSDQYQLYNFLYPRNNYYGEFKPEYVVFNANLQEFSQQVS